MAASANNDINEFLRSNNLAINTLHYLSSPLEPVTADSRTGLFSDERRRLTLGNNRFQLYDGNDGRLFLDGTDFSRTYDEIIEMQKNGIPETVPDYSPDVNVIYNLVQVINRIGVSIFGTNQKNYDTWKVINDHYLNVALHKSRESGEEQLTVVNGSDNEIYIINHDEDQVLIREPEASYYKPDETFYELHDTDGQVILDNIPLEKLATVLIALMRGFNSDQVKSKFLWPNLSADLLAETDLIFERDFYSDVKEIKSAADFEAVSELPIHEDNDHLVSKYHFQDKYGSQLELPVSDSEITNIFKYRYNDFPIDTKDAENDLTELVLSISDQLHLLILRSQRRLVSISDHTQITLDKDDTFNVSANKRDKKQEYMVESVFTLVDKKTEEKIAQDITLDKLIELMWMHTVEHESEDEGGEDE